MIITRIWKGQGGKFFCISSKSAGGVWKDHFFQRSQFRDVPRFLKENADKDLYFCPHGFEKKRRHKSCAVMPKLLWSDMDAADPRTVRIKPTIAIESSPGRFVGLWMIDGEMREDVNRRLSKLIGGDPGGWDLTQVLRIPGTTNYKYTTMPRVRIMWTDGPSYELGDLERQLPPDDDHDDVTQETDAAKIYKDWQKKMPPWLRRELTRRKDPPVGSRSEMMFKIAAECIEIGMERDEVLAMLGMTLWNKYSGRRNEAQMLRDLWERAVNKKGQAARPVAGEDDDEHYRYLTRSMADREARDIDWIWYGYLARGEVTLLSGDPEAGKSFIAQNIAGCLCQGEPLPSHVKDPPRALKGRIAYFDIENSPDTVTKKRLIWQNFSMDAQANYYQEEMPFSINDDDEMERVVEALERIKPILIVFDTLNTYIGRTDTNAGAETQQTAIKFKSLAERFNCSVLVLRHLTKGARDKAMYRGAGSIALTGVARIEMIAGHHPEDPDMRLMAQAKNNLVAKPPALSYEIRSVGTSKERDRARFEWGEYDRSLNAEHIVAAPKEKDTTERDTAKELLLEALADGPVEKTRVEQMAEARSISQRTLYRAMRDLGVRSKTKGFGKDRVAWWSIKLASESSPVDRGGKRT